MQNIYSYYASYIHMLCYGLFMQLAVYIAMQTYVASLCILYNILFLFVANAQNEVNSSM